MVGDVEAQYVLDMLQLGALSIVLQDMLWLPHGTAYQQALLGAQQTLLEI